MLVTSGGQSASPVPPVGGYERFERGALVDVLDKSRNVWMPAVVILDWAEVDTATGRRSFCYDCDGEDDLGPFHGRWDQSHIRQRQSELAATPAGGNA